MLSLHNGQNRNIYKLQIRNNNITLVSVFTKAAPGSFIPLIFHDNNFLIKRRVYAFITAVLYLQ